MPKKRSPQRTPQPTARGIRQGARGGASDDRQGNRRKEEPPAKSYVPSPAAIRETIESVVIAFVLAFLFRTFEAEAFVIPTGSMAPTLMGRHKDLECGVCGYPYRVSASEEVNPDSNKLTGNWVEESVCPMCRYPMHLGSGKSVLDKYPSFKGDRILVGKACYQFSGPKRWDVAVFKYPGGAQTNFIKRLAGLPGEVLWISRGDIFSYQVGAGEGVDADGNSLPSAVGNLTEAELRKLSADRNIERKSPDKLLSMLQPVFDNDVTPKIVEMGLPARWRPWRSRQPLGSGQWQTSQDYSSFEIEPSTPSGSEPAELWLRYEHRVPSRRQWRQQIKPHEPDRPDVQIEPQPICDFSAYNSNYCPDAPHGSRADTVGDYWVGDLAIGATLKLRSDQGEVVFELLEGGYRMQCRIDVATGEATLAIDPEDPYGQPALTGDGQAYVLTAQTEIRRAGEYEILFSNVDDQLRLWIDGGLVLFGDSDAATCYRPLPNHRRQPSDLAPVGVASRGAALQIGHLKIMRDVYYRADGPRQSDREFVATANPRYSGNFGHNSGPSRIWNASTGSYERVLQLRADQFLALGDNSARSKDGRLWGEEFYVSRRLLIGKALIIYWPHSWDKLPGIGVPFPFFPNFSRMAFIR